MPVPPAPAPAAPEGVAPASLFAGTTVTAVTVLWLPSGNVLVRSTTDVLEDRRVVRVDAVADGGDGLPPLEPERVT